EGSDEEQMQNLFEEIQNKYDLFDNCVLETCEPQDTIIDYEEGRFEETGELAVLPKDVVMEAIKESDEVKFNTNLKGMNAIYGRGKEIYLTDEECENLVKQIVDNFGYKQLGVGCDRCGGSDD
ncbi:hypothetical protein KY326_03725, partial [Candidatus Woesearchaeota archaeon]|nr:hypothetical protein [Candidatus Woesearchaeota archaeon]